MNIENTNTKIKVENYGDMIAKVLDLNLLSYREDGDYSGSYIAILTDGKFTYGYSGEYGSCSGCDWLESEIDWDTNEVEYKSALDYCQQLKMNIKIPYTTFKKLSSDIKKEMIFETFNDFEKEYIKHAINEVIKDIEKT